MFKTLRIILFCLISVVSFGNCLQAKQQQTEPSLPNLTDQRADFSGSEHGISVLAKTLSQGECQKAFGTKAALLTAGDKPLYPVQLAVFNNSEKAIRVAPKYISMPLATHKEVEQILTPTDAKKHHNGILWLTVGTLVGALVACTVVATGFLGALFIGPTAAAFAVLGTSVCIGGVLTLTPLCVGIYEVSTAKENSLSSAVSARINSSVSLKPGTSKEMLVFVHKKDFKNEFEITFKAKKKRPNKTTFKISIATPDYIGGREGIALSTCATDIK